MRRAFSCGTWQSDDFGQTPLHITAQNGHDDVLRALVAAHADVNQLTNEHDSALHMAAQNGMIDVVRVLLNANANVNQLGNDHATPLYMAAQNGHCHVLTVLIAEGGNVHQTLLPPDSRTANRKL